jgi:RNA polymerase sigma factor (TIGR02999 family)
MHKTPSPKQHDITELLAQWSGGNQTVLDKLYPLVYEELRRIARSYMKREPVGHTLQTTALINEAYVRMVDQKDVRWRNRSHFFAISAQMMRRILVDHARRYLHKKRGGGARKISLDEAMIVAEERSEEVLMLDEALDNLARIDPRRCQVVEMRYFAGLNNQEIASILRISENTVMRDWNLARAWLYQRLGGAG